MYPTASVSVIYQADPAWPSQVAHKRAAVMNAVHACMGHTVHIQTVDGQTYEGILVGVDGRHVLLQVSERGCPTCGPQRAFYNPAAATILPLVLFELLVIVLLS